MNEKKKGVEQKWEFGLKAILLAHDLLCSFVDLDR